MSSSDFYVEVVRVADERVVKRWGPMSEWRAGATAHRMKDKHDPEFTVRVKREEVEDE